MRQHVHNNRCGCAIDRQPLAELTGRLRQGASKVTGPRQAILDVLRRNPHPLTRKEIFAGLPAGDCDLATVYRSLHLLERLSMVQRYDFGDGVARFELVDQAGSGHHHHLVCQRCWRVVELDGCGLTDIETAIAERNGFTAVSHKLEFFGICPACQ